MSVILYAKKRWGVCKCGHYDWQHSDSIQKYIGTEKTWIRAEGQGECGHPECECEQFTWIGFKEASP